MNDEMGKDLHEIVELVQKAMQVVPDPNPIRQASTRQRFLSEAHRLRDLSSPARHNGSMSNRLSLFPTESRRRKMRGLLIAITLIVVSLTSGMFYYALNMSEPAIRSVMLTPGTSFSGQGTAKITSENAAQVVELARMGNGTVNGVAVSPDGNTLALYGSLGIWFYNIDALSAPSHFLETNTYILDCAYSPDGTLLVTGNFDGTVRIFDVATGTERLIIHAHQKGVFEVAFSPDGRNVASSSNWSDPSVRVWSVETGRELLNLPYEIHSSVSGLSFSPDGNTLAASGLVYVDSAERTTYLQELKYGVMIWDLRPANFGEPLATLVGPKDLVSEIAYAPDGSNNIAASSFDGNVYVWHFSLDNLAPSATLDPVSILNESSSITADRSQVSSLAYSSDSNLIAVLSSDLYIRLWDAQSGEYYKSIRISPEERGWVGLNSQQIQFMPDTHYLVKYAGSVQLWNIETGDIETSVDPEGSSLSSVAFDSIGRQVAAGSRNGSVFVWDSHDNVQIGALESIGVPSASIYDVAFLPTSTLLAIASASPDGKALSLWDVDSGEQHTFAEPLPYSYSSLDLSADGSQLVGASSEGYLNLWNVANQTLIASLQISPDNLVKWVSQVAYSPSGNLVAFLDGGYNIRLWDLTTLNEITPLRGHSERLQRVAFSSDGGHLASLDSGGTLLLWDLQDMSEIGFVETGMESGSLAFSPDSSLLAIGGLEDVSIWDLAPLVELAVLKGHTGPVADIAFSYDQTLITTASDDGTVRLWGIP